MDKLKELIIRSQRGEVEAYTEIVQRFKDMAVGYAFSVMGDFHLAEDAAQEAFIQAYQDLLKLSDPLAFPGWLRRIVFKHCDRIMRKKRPPLFSPEVIYEIPSAQQTPEEEFEQQEIKHQIHTMLEALPLQEQQVVALFYLSEHSRKEIAAFLEIPLTVVIYRLRSARIKLKKGMVPMAKSSFPDRASSTDDQFTEQIKFNLEQLPKNSTIVWLRSVEEDVCFPLFFEPDDYRVIQAQLDGEATFSSLMHQLFGSFLDQTQARLEEMRIAKVEEDTVYVELVFALGSEKIQLDVAVSNSTDGADIFALVLRFQSPIYISRKCLNVDVQAMVPIDRQVKHVADLARQEAVRLGHCYLGTEHFLLGMIKDSEGKAAQIMTHWGSKLEDIKKSIEDLVGPTDDTPGYPISIGQVLLPLTPRTQNVLDMAAEEARQQGVDCMDIEHLLLALARDKESISAQILETFGLGHEILKKEIGAK